jgi:hypothetical protein
MIHTERHRKTIAAATSKALTKCWADPKWRKKTLAARAKRRSVQLKNQAYAWARAWEQAYGLPEGRYDSMTEKERRKYSWDNRRVLPSTSGNRTEAAKRHGVKLSTWLVMSGRERDTIKKKNKEKKS